MRAKKQGSKGRGESKRKAEVKASAFSDWGGLLLLYLGLGLASGLIWLRLANLSALPSWHLEMVSGTAPAPNQYRPLTPWLAEALARAMGGNMVTAYFTLRAVTTGVTLFLFDRYLRAWFAPAAAAGGALCLAATIPFTYFAVVQESDPLNLLAFVLAYWALAQGRDLWLIPLTLVGTLNREAVAMIPAVYLLARWGQERPGRLAWRTVAMGGAWALAYGGMLAAYGGRAYYCNVVMLGLNLSSWIPTVHVILMFGALWGLAFAGQKQGPVMLRRALWLAPPYVALHYVVAMAREVRVLLPLAPVLIPLSWWALFPEAVRPEAREEARERRA